MENEIIQDIVLEVKKFLNITEECSSAELYDLLVRYRNQIHPDKFIDNIAKKDAEEKFKETVRLINELFNYIENEKLKRSPTELTLYKPLYDHIYLQRELEVLQQRINDYKTEIENLNRSNQELKDEIEHQNDESLKKEIKYLEGTYKPTLKSWASVGIVFLLSSTLMAITKIEEVSDILKKYSPFNEILINYILFFIFIFVLVITLKQYLESKIIDKKIGDICSANNISDFMEHITKKYNYSSYSKKIFTESDVYKYLARKELFIKKVLAMLGFRIYQMNTIDKLKDVFIYKLLTKKLIDISMADALNRQFIVKDKERY